jgi:ABC-type transport system involved in multi-copper enzyme maturation permease subunit
VNLVTRLLAANPVLDRELRQRSRSQRAPVLLVVFLGLLLATAVLVELGQSAASGDPWRDPWATPSLPTLGGRAMLEWLLSVMLLVLLFIVPGISANAVSGERERQTLVPLQVTLMGPAGILVGKIGASSAFALLLVVASAPLLALPYLVGGVSLTQVLLALFVLAVVAVVLATLGVTCSAIFRRTQTATLMAYGLVLVLVIGTPVALAAAAVIDTSRGGDGVDPPIALVYPNPFVALADAAGSLDIGVQGPFSPLKRALIEVGHGTVDLAPTPDGWVGFDRFGNEVPIGDLSAGFPIWARSLAILAGGSAVLFGLAWRRLRTPAAVDR